MGKALLFVCRRGFCEKPFGKGKRSTFSLPERKRLQKEADEPAAQPALPSIKCVALWLLDSEKQEKRKVRRHPQPTAFEIKVHERAL